MQYSIVKEIELNYSYIVNSYTQPVNNEAIFKLKSRNNKDNNKMLKVGEGDGICKVVFVFPILHMS